MKVLFSKIKDKIRSFYTNRVRRNALKLLIFFAFPTVIFFIIFNPFIYYETEVLRESNMLYSDYFFPPSRDVEAPFSWISDLINTSLNVGWYKICLINNSNLLLNGEKIDYEELSGSSGSMMISILPIVSNAEYKEYFDYINFKNRNLDEHKREYIFEYNLTAEKNSKACTSISAREIGILFQNVNVKVGNSYLPATFPDGHGSVKLIVGDLEYEVAANDSKLILSAPIFAILIKFIIFWLLMSGVMFAFHQILYFMFKKNDKQGFS